MGNDEAGFSGGSWGQVLRFIISEIGCWKPFAGKCVIARLDPRPLPTAPKSSTNSLLDEEVFDGRAEILGFWTRT